MGCYICYRVHGRYHINLVHTPTAHWANDNSVVFHGIVVAGLDRVMIF